MISVCLGIASVCLEARPVLALFCAEAWLHGPSASRWSRAIVTANLRSLDMPIFGSTPQVAASAAALGKSLLLPAQVLSEHGGPLIGDP